MNNRISLESQIWDLHIHTCCCPKGSSDFSTQSIEDYIKGLLGAFAACPDLTLISFTDHNHISKEVYHAFENAKTSVNLLPGIECDVYLDQETKTRNRKNYKHLIFYFKNDGVNPFDVDKDGEALNKWLEDNNLPILADLLNFLITSIKKPFLISPHFMKQGDRGIQTSWPNPEDIKANIDKYIDQMFCFWETSSAAEIARATQYLQDCERGGKVSLIHFSDSNNYTTLKNYLAHPAQYFLSLPTFDGVRMAGSDCRRITKDKITFIEDEKGKYLGAVTIGGQNICFSPRLNCLIGGRGSGKSLLLDSIAEQIIPDSNFDKERKAYIDERGYLTFDMKGNRVLEKSLALDYFNQGYINDLFSKNIDIASTRYFESEFASLHSFSADEKRSELVQDMDFKDLTKKEITDNLSSFVETYSIVPEKQKLINLGPLGRKKQLIEFINYEDYIQKINRIVPKEIQSVGTVISSEIHLFREVSESIEIYNRQLIIESLFASNLKAKNIEIVSSKTERLKKKNASLNLFRLLFQNASLNCRRRVAIINSLLKLSCTVSQPKPQENPYPAEANDLIIFSKELHIQPIVNYLLSTIRESIDGTLFVGKYHSKKEDLISVRNLIQCFCYSFNDFKNSSFSTNGLISELSSLTHLEITTPSKIYFVGKDRCRKDLALQSPGTRANILMEYLLFKKTHIPLLIDQPEDNIDNQTIFGKLATWFSDVKSQRQVIVATHDANIVVNADCENVIVCIQKENDVFDYRYGALEYGNTINDVATILEGGKEAIERRMNKYGRK